jgi:uncharacterized membrane protein
MIIDPALWPKLHGASVHFPIALTMAAALFDGLGYAWPGTSPRKTQLHAAGSLTIILGALGVVPAVLSGLFMTRGETMGHDAMLFHHLFVWPAFATLVGLGVWRALVGEQASPRGFAVYLVVQFLTAGLMAGAGYWGGELLLNS